MSTLTEIEEAASKLSPEEFAELLRWMREREAAVWDRQIEEDAKSGRLDALHARLQKEDGDEPEVSLDDFLDQAELREKV